MPIVAAAGFLLFVILLVVVLMPISLVQRYRVGVARRPARGWVATLNVVAFSLSATLLLASAAVTSLWVPGAFAAAIGGIAAGGVVALVGLSLTRWEVRPGAVHFTPNRWLVLGLTVVVSARILYGFWRGWYAWRAAPSEASWLVASGASGSLAAGAVVLGYYGAYWFGVRRRIARYRRTARGGR